MAISGTAFPRATVRSEARSSGALRRTLVIGIISFLTLVDLFAAQAILPSLARAYAASPAEISVAVNASTMGMAVAGLLVALFSRHINRRHGIWVSLALLAIPTGLLAGMPDLATFTGLRIAQGIFMSAAFTLTVAYLAEQCSAEDAASALAAYVTGNVASNLFGRLMSAALADSFGLSINFAVFAGLNLLGAALVFVSLKGTTPMMAAAGAARPAFAAWVEHFRNPALASAFAVGFLILFAFIGTFTYVNFQLVSDTIGLSPMSLGFVYAVFLPSMLTTPVAGSAVRRFGFRPVFLGAMTLALAGLPMVLAASLPSVLAGLVLIAAGTFFAQAATTGYVSRTATGDRGSASGIYLASYYCGGLVGTAVLGAAYMHFGWMGCVAGIAAALLLCAALAFRMR